MRTILSILYVVSPETESLARAQIEEAGGLARRGARGRDWMVVSALNRTHQLRMVTKVSQAQELLREQYFNFVVLDDRRPDQENEDCTADSLAKSFLKRVHYSGDPEHMYPLQRIIAILDTNECLADQVFAMGKFRIGGFVATPFDGSLFKMMRNLQGNKVPGKSALCLAGGGVEGFLFQLGVVKALNAHLQNASITDFDIFCGISAGSFLGAFLANKVEPEEIDAAMMGTHETMDPIKPGIIFDPDVKEYASRIWTLARKLPLMNPSDMVSTLIKSVPAGFFRGDSLREFVEKGLLETGRSNDFRELSRELYIGATDQDQSTHVVFGHGQWRDIPISTAVRASTALTPFFEPAVIRGRNFVDGQYTRTSNFHFAMERGAKFVIVVDPLIPIRVQESGYVKAKGGVFSALQALKAVIHTRFMHGIRSAVQNYPDVDFILFKPEGEDMRLMSGSPMKYNIRTEIVNMAYRCTVRKIQRDFEILGRTFARHGFRIQRHPRLRSPHNEIT